MKNGKRNEEITWFVLLFAFFRVIDNDDEYENDTNEF